MTAATRIGAIMGVALLAASALVVRLGQRGIAISKAYAELRTKATLPYRGYAVPTFRAAALTGDSITVGQLPDSGGRQVVLVFTTTCPYCRATLPVWKQLADSLGGFGRGESWPSASIRSASRGPMRRRRDSPIPCSPFPIGRRRSGFGRGPSHRRSC